MEERFATITAVSESVMSIARMTKYSPSRDIDAHPVVSIMSNALPLLTEATIVVDFSMRIVGANAAAERYLIASQYLTTSGPRLHASEALQHDALKRAIAAACIPPVSRSERVVQIGGGNLLDDQVICIHSLPIEFDDGLLLAMIVIRKRPMTTGGDESGVARALGLSPAEARLAIRLTTGGPLATVAKSAGIGLETARWHLKHIFQKTGTRRQSELVALILRSGY
jgi:DNA-binding CsgD family transcriptional regulator